MRPEATSTRSRILRPIVLLVTATLLASLGVSPAVAAPGRATPAEAKLLPHVPGTLLVGFAPGATAADRAAARASARVSSASRLSPLAPDAEKWRLPDGADLGRAIESLARNPRIRFAEPDYLVTTLDTSNDAYYTSGQLWGMHGDSITPYANQFGSGADEAWAAGRTGSRNVYIGVIDEGIQVTHPDLTTNIWVNPDEIRGNGIDDDSNGYIDDMNGWDFFSNDASVFDGTTGSSVDAHGTHVSGTIGGLGGNGIGVAGVNWNVTIISGKFLGSGGGSTSGAILAVDYMTNLKRTKGLNIVATSNSWGGGGFSQGLLDAIERGGDEGILFVAAAGNSTTNNDSGSYYPTNYQCTKGGTRGWDCVVSVAAIDSSGNIASFSSYGATTVDIGAPGVGVWSSVPVNSYASYSGTSMATPHVSGAVALCASINPSLTPAQLKSAILGSAVPTASLAGKTLTGGRLDAGALPTICLPSTEPPTGTVTGLTAATASLSSILLTWTDGVTGETSYEIQRAPGTLATCGTFTTVASAPGDSTSATIGGLASSTDYCFRVRGTNTFNGTSVTAWSDPASARTASPPPAYVCSAAAFEWIDPSGGTVLTGGDDVSSLRALPFTFTSYGSPYSSVTISSNGYLRLGSGAATSYTNVAIPSTADPNATIAPAWDDWNPGAGGQVSYRTVGTAPARSFVVTWAGIPHFSLAGSAVSFQAILEEGGDVVRFQYLDMIAGSATYDRGQSATAGVEGPTGEWGTQISNNQAILSDGTAYRCSATVGVPPTIASAVHPDGTTGVAYETSVSATGGTAPYAWTIASGSLPAGLTLDRSTGSIAGTPTSAVNASFTVRATGTDGGSSTRAMTIRVANPLAITTASLPTGSTGGAYTVALTSSGGTAPLSWSVVDGSLPAGLSLGGSTGAISGTPTVVGTSTFTVAATDAGQPAARTATATLSIAVVGSLTLAATSYADGTTGTAYAVNHATTNGTGPFTWSVSTGALPGGLAIDPSTGTVAGTPTTAGTFTFEVKATDANGSIGTAAGQIQVAAPLSVTTSSLASGVAGVAYSASVVSTGGRAPIVWSVASGALPAGLSLNASSGAITGTPTAAGSFSVTLRATDDGRPVKRVADRALTIAIGLGKQSPANAAVVTRATSVTVSWYPHDAATAYRYCRATSASKCTSFTLVGTATSATITGLSFGKTYYWQVQANVNGVWVSANGGTVWRFSIPR
ncbi:MAG: hypothetical protein RL338_619 [Chloroflexota bacterium]